jgi:hypothetical protein
MNRRRLGAYGALALLALTTARFVAGDLAALHRRAQAMAPGPPVTTATTAPGTAAVPPGMRAFQLITEPPWTPPPGSVVDVFAADRLLGTDAGPARLVAGRAVVIAQPPRARPARTDDAGRVTLLVSVDAARLVAAAAASGPVVLALAPDKEHPSSKTSSSASSRE